MKKSISIQHQGINGGAISPSKIAGFVALFFDGMKIVVDAYNGNGQAYVPREKSLIQIVEKKEVFEMTSDQLLEAIKFYADYSEKNKENPIIRYRNKHHYLIPDGYSKD